MEYYVIERTDQGGGYVTPPGKKNSHTHYLQHARQFATREGAGVDLVRICFVPFGCMSIWDLVPIVCPGNLEVSWSIGPTFFGPEGLV